MTRERVVRWEDPTASAAVARGLSGIEAMRAYIAGDIPPPPIAMLMGFRLVEAGDGSAAFEGTPGEEHYNPLGTVHGGYAMALFDSALGCSIHTRLPAGVGYTTTDVQVRLIRGLTKETGLVRCEASVVHVGRSTAIAEARLYDRERRVLGFATTGCAVLRP